MNNIRGDRGISLLNQAHTDLPKSDKERIDMLMDQYRDRHVTLYHIFLEKLMSLWQWIMFLFVLVITVGMVILMMVEILPILDFSLLDIILDDMGSMFIFFFVLFGFALLLMGTVYLMDNFNTQQFKTSWIRYLNENGIDVERLQATYPEHDDTLILGLIARLYANRLDDEVDDLDIIEDIVGVSAKELRSAIDIHSNFVIETKDDSYPILSLEVALVTLPLLLLLAVTQYPQFDRFPTSSNPWDYVLYLLYLSGLSIAGAFALLSFLSLLSAVFSGKIKFLPHDISFSEYQNIINQISKYADFLENEAKKQMNYYKGFFRATYFVYLPASVIALVLLYLSIEIEDYENFITVMVVSILLMVIFFGFIVHLYYSRKIVARQQVEQYLRAQNPTLFNQYSNKRLDIRSLRDLIVRQLMDQDFSSITKAVQNARSHDT